LNVTPVGFAGTVAAVGSGVARGVGAGASEAVGTAEASPVDGVGVGVGAATIDGRPGAVLAGKALRFVAGADWQAAVARQVASAKARPKVSIRVGRT
jgi:hypothetical protein